MRRSTKTETVNSVLSPGVSSANAGSTLSHRRKGPASSSFGVNRTNASLRTKATMKTAMPTVMLTVMSTVNNNNNSLVASYAKGHANMHINKTCQQTRNSLVDLLFQKGALHSTFSIQCSV